MTIITVNAIAIVALYMSTISVPFSLFPFSKF